MSSFNSVKIKHFWYNVPAPKLPLEIVSYQAIKDQLEVLHNSINSDFWVKTYEIKILEHYCKRGWRSDHGSFLYNTMLLAYTRNIELQEIIIDFFKFNFDTIKREYYIEYIYEIEDFMVYVIDYKKIRGII